MKRRIIKYFSIAFLAIGLLFMGVTMASSSSEPSLASISISNQSATTNADVTETSPGQNVVEDPGVVEQYGPPGVIVTTVLTGILMIVRNYNEGRKIDVTTYKERATDAEVRSNEEIGKVHKKLEDLERKLDAVIKDRDEYRDTLEDRKAQFTQQILDIEVRHQHELEGQHAALVMEIHIRHKLERILAEHGIEVPDSPPPYTKAMQKAVTSQDQEHAAVVASNMKIIQDPE